MAPINKAVPFIYFYPKIVKDDVVRMPLISKNVHATLPTTKHNFPTERHTSHVVKLTVRANG